VAQFKLTSVHFIKILLHETLRKSEPIEDRIVEWTRTSPSGYATQMYKVCRLPYKDRKKKCWTLL
jgi:hypothetical protein